MTLKTTHSNIFSKRPIFAIAAELMAVLFFVVSAYCFVLRFVFPGYLSPIWPYHNDFYMPAAVAGGVETALSYWRWPRPVGMMFAVLTGNLGIRGSMAAVIFLTLVNVTLSAFIFRRIALLDYSWQFMVGVLLYSYFMFSEPYFYVFYAQDSFAQLSFFLLLVGLIVYYSFSTAHPVVANLALFTFGVVAFLAKETYCLSALGLAGAFFLFSPAERRWQSLLPLFSMLAALVLCFAVGIAEKSVFLGQVGDPQRNPYRVDVSPASISHEWWRYASGALNIATLAALALMVSAEWRSGAPFAKRRAVLMVSCILAASVAWLPNAALPAHYFPGYSWNGAYLLFLPFLLSVPLFSSSWTGFARLLAVVAAVAASPILDQQSYAGDAWVLQQETTQRNLLTSLFRLIDALPSDRPQRVLISGLSFPFSPFRYPDSLRRVLHGRSVQFAVVSYSNSADITGAANVKFLRPEEIELTSYDFVWAFGSDGSLISASLGPESGSAADDSEQLSTRDYALFPDVANVVPQADPRRRTGLDAEALMSLGPVWLQYGQNSRAMTAFQRSSELAPTNPYPYFYMGSILKATGRKQEAMSAYSRAVALDDPNNRNEFFNQALEEMNHELSVSTQ